MMTIGKIVPRIFSRSLSLCLLSVIAVTPATIAQENSAPETIEGFPSEDCTFPDLELPEDFVVYTTGAYDGRPLSYQIDQSNHSATQIDVVANSPSQPVVLMLGAYEPTIWNIQWTEGTNIVAVLASGYHHQAVAGLPEETPVLTSTFDNDGECGYFYLTPEKEKYGILNPLSRKLFGQAVEMIFPIDDSATVVVGEPLEGSPDLLSSDDTTVESFFDLTAPLTRRAGIEEALKKGLLREATEEDAEAWVEAQMKARESNSEQGIPPIAREEEIQPSELMYENDYNSYVVLGNFTYPAGLYGAHSVVFFIPKGVPTPSGNPGHSTVYDFNTGECSGLCSW